MQFRDMMGGDLHENWFKLFLLNFMKDTVDGCFHKREYLKIVPKYKGSVQRFHSVVDLDFEISWCVLLIYSLHMSTFV